jgi:hypothetical protein
MLICERDHTLEEEATNTEEEMLAVQQETIAVEVVEIAVIKVVEENR